MGFIGKRLASGNGRRRRREPRAADRSGPVKREVEALEGRVLFSSSVFGTAVSVVWRGQTVQAYQNQWVVETSNAARFQTVAAAEGFTAVTSLGGGGFYQFTSTDSPVQMAKLAKAHPVALGTVEPNEVIKAASVTVPNDPSFSAQWGLSNTGQLESFDYNIDGLVTPYDKQTYPNGLPGGAATDFPTPQYPDENHYGLTGDDIGATQAWGVTTGSKDVVVAVLDTGIDLTNPDLVDNIWTNPLDTAANGYNGDGYPGDLHGYNFVSNTGDPTDDFGHGTNVAGIIGASGDNGQGVTGVNWHVSLVAVKVLSADGSGSDASIIAGINYVTNLKDHGINVVAMNESLGGTAFPTSILTSDALRQAGKAGVLDVVAAGNSSEDVDRTPTSPAYESTALDNVITVAAVDNQFKLAAFSNFGADSVDLAAPGVNILATAPTYEVTETGGYYNAGQPPYYNPPGFGLGYGYESGTSQATPFVTGIIALEAAANPSATPAQLKEALLKGVTYDPNLASVNGTPAKVLTSGVANAYGAVEAVLNPFDGVDATRQGTWHSYYGYQGAYVVGDSTGFPTGTATVSTSGGSPVIVQNDTKNPAALQRVADPTERVLAYEASATSETIHLSFNDDVAHRTELYVVDPDHQKRNEVIFIVDALTGVRLDTEFVSNFTKGQYLSWDLRGQIDIVVNNISGGAAYSGLFFDYPPSRPGTYQGTDATTSGTNWRNTYGSQGFFLAGDDNSGTLPSYVSAFDVAGGTATVLKPAVRAAVGLQRTSDLTHNIEAYYAAPDHEDVNITFDDTLVHTVTLYVADYNNKRRSERVQVIDNANGGILVTQDLTNFKKGEFVSFAVSGDVTLRVSRTGGTDAVVSGVFFDAPFGENAHFAGTNTTLGGNWAAGVFGSTAAYVVGDNFPGVDAAANAQISITGATRDVVAVPTNDKRALFKTEANLSSTRVEAYAYTTSSMTISYNPGDYVQHQLTLYFADYQNAHRTEAVTLYNASTNTVLSHQVVTNFQKGKYLTYDVSGPVLIVINNGTVPNAVLSGLFID